MIEDLIGEIETALDKYKYYKYSDAELEEDTAQEIYNECRRFLEHVKEKAEELDSTIDDLICDDPSTYEYDLAMDNLARTRDLIGG